jgi:hypothetical protein
MRPALLIRLASTSGGRPPSAGSFCALYVTAAPLGVFHDAQRPAGYPIFLRLVHLFSESLSFTILVQHALGVATGLRRR